MSRNRDKITPIEGVAGIRSRPQVFLPDLNHPEVINYMLQECLCIPLDNALNGCASEIRIQLSRDRSISLWDNGPPLPLQENSSEPAIQTLLTKLHACREAKRAHLKELCRVGIVVANAFSEWFVVESAMDAIIWRQRYERGDPTGPFVAVGMAEATWERMAFRPDASFFGEARVDVSAFRQ